jgi:hypothetical protein
MPGEMDDRHRSGGQQGSQDVGDPMADDGRGAMGMTPTVRRR